MIRIKVTRYSQGEREWLLNPAHIAGVEFRPQVLYDDGRLMNRSSAVVYLVGVVDGYDWGTTHKELVVEDAESIIRLLELEG